MPLLDHFHPPLTDDLSSWESFHSFWTVAIGKHLNQMLPQRYRALVTTHLGSRVEADVAEYERRVEVGNGSSAESSSGGLAVQTWAPPTTQVVAPAVFPDDFEIQVMENRGGYRLVAVVEMASPATLDRPDSRRAFAAKCAAYLQRGIGVIAIDIVTDSHFNLHNELVELMHWGEPLRMPEAVWVYAVAYRPVHRQERNEIDIWPVELTVGGALPVLPLALKGTRAIPLDLELTYMDARQQSRL